MSDNGILQGDFFIDGDTACAEGAICAGCRFFGGYPITPATEIAERMARRLPQVGGTYIQMEDEIASITAVLGASWAGQRAMTATSGPGFSLMMENIGLGVMTETPCVVVNIQRGGPSTGLPTATSQSDMMQAKWGSHGDYEIIAYAPASCQEMFDLTIQAFNAADRYRTPVLLMADEVVGHMTERVVVPEEPSIFRQERKAPTTPPGEPFKLFHADEDLIPPMPKAGDGYNMHVTGLTHDERGYPATNAEAQEQLVRRLVDKIRIHANDIVQVEEVMLTDAEVAVVSFGSSARSARRAVALAREQGVRVGLLRLVTVWPFPGNRIAELSARVKALVVAETNLGQMVGEVERFSQTPVLSVTHAGGEALAPDPILEAIQEAIR